MSDPDLLAIVDLGPSMARAIDGTILYWAQGCVDLYGWTKEEAVGRNAHELLRTGFPCPLVELEAALQAEGRWAGDLRHYTKEGVELVVTAQEVLMRRGAEAAIVLEALIDVTRQRQSELELQRRELQLRTIAETLNGLLYVKDGGGRMSLVNSALLTAIGKSADEVLGKTDRELLSNIEQADAVIANDRAILESGIAREVEETVDLADGQRRTFLSMKAPMRDDDGHAVGLVGFSVDITERKRFEKHLRQLVDELNHRVKNTLATVQAIAFNLLIDRDPALFDALTDRLGALASVHDLLTEERWTEADLRTVVANVIAPYDRPDTDRFRLHGPVVKLRPRAAVALSIGLNELVTNAVKYGALSTAAGQVAIDWSLDDQRRRLRLDWRETGGPPVAPPTSRGFGTRMIEHVLARDLQGSARLEFSPTGVRCSISAATSAVLSEPADTGLRAVWSDP